jgi:hypothetical protein
MLLYLLIPLSCRCSLLCCPLLLLAVFLSILRCGGSLISRRRTPFLHPGPFLIPSATKSFDNSQFSLVQVFLKTFLLRRATVARQDTFLQVAANFLRDPQSPRVSSIGSPRHPAVSFWPLCRFLSPSMSSLGTS